MKTRTELMNTLIAEFGFDSYLEIGLQNKQNNFNKINLPDHKKISIDPDILANADFAITSDLFFKQNEELETPMRFDLIFIDGLHHADQVKRDFENAVRCLTARGIVVIHDSNPDEEIYTRVPRETKRWFGDVYKFICTLHQYTSIDFCTLDMDCGCCVIWRSTKKVYSQVNKLSIDDIDWDFFQQNKPLINLTPADQEGMLNRINHNRIVPV